MSDALYNIVFQGKIQADFDLQQVKDNLGKLFSAGEDKIDMMFSGKPIAIKKSVDQATALKYLQAMKKSGAIAHTYTLEGKVIDLTQPQQKAQDEKETAPNPAEPASKNTSDTLFDTLTVAPPGEQLIPTQTFVEAQFNTEGMSMAPVGSDVTDREPPPPPYQADLSNLSMANPGERVLDPDAPPSDTRGTKLNFDKE